MRPLSDIISCACSFTSTAVLVGCTFINVREACVALANFAAYAIAFCEAFEKSVGQSIFFIGVVLRYSIKNYCLLSAIDEFLFSFSSFLKYRLNRKLDFKAS